MASKAKSICRHPGCNKAIDVSGYCELHKRNESGWCTTSKISAVKRGYGWAWQQLRSTILERDSGLCQACRIKGYITLATEVDHIVAKALGGTDDEANLQAICRSCHAKKTALDRRRKK
jgi:5-methylcytosine-specific restriction protein A